jgi:uncharacterized membrane protein HdeD (DUF308 family)
MEDISMSVIARDPFSFLGEIHRQWGWFLALGIVFVLTGALCVVADVTATFATVLFFGWLLLISGVAALIHAFTAGSWRGSLLCLLSAVLRGFTGYLLVRYPAAGAFSLTLLLASFFVVGGSFRALGAGMIKFPRWGWSVISGLLSVALGVMLLTQLPISSIWFIGFAIGIDAIVEGVALIGFASAMHHLPADTAHRAT